MDPTIPKRHLYFIAERALPGRGRTGSETMVPEPACRRVMSRSRLQRRNYPAKFLFPLLAREEFANPLPRSRSRIGDEGSRYGIDRRLRISIRDRKTSIACNLREGAPVRHHRDALTGHRLGKRDAERLPVGELAVDLRPAIPADELILPDSPDKLNVIGSISFQEFKGVVKGPADEDEPRLGDLRHTVRTILSFWPPGEKNDVSTLL